MMRTVDLPALILFRKDARDLSFLLGETIKAEVIDTNSEGMVSLRIKGNIIDVRTEIPFELGQVIELRVMGTRPDGNLEMKFTGFLTTHDKGRVSSQDLQSHGFLNSLVHSLVDMVNSGLHNIKPAKFNQMLLNVLKAMPDNDSMMPDTLWSIQKTLLTVLVTKIDPITGRLLDLIKMLPEDIEGKAQTNRLKAIGHNIKNLLMAIEELQVDKLKNLLENTGTLLETRLKRIVENNRIEETVDILDKDLKANLLRLTKDSLFKTGAETLIRDIETFQALSKVTDSVFTFLPLIWKDLKDGDISFKRRKDKGSVPSYSCRISLDLRRYGRVTVLVVLHDQSLFVSFMVQDSGFRQILEDNRERLQRAFTEKGLNLKAINVNVFDSLFTWSETLDGVDIEA